MRSIQIRRSLGWASLLLSLVPLSPLLSPAAAATDPARSLYEGGRYTEAKAVLESTLATLPANSAQRAAALSNLALVSQELGQMAAAKAAIEESVQILQTRSQSDEQQRILAQTLTIQGKLDLASGQGEQAIDHWKAAEKLYTQLKDSSGVRQSQINQAQALQTLGLYRQALKTLLQVNESLQTEPNAPVKAMGLRALGDTLRVLGSYDQSQAALEQSLAVAESAQLQDIRQSALLSLGNTARAQSNSSAALAFYRQAAETPGTSISRVQAQLNQLSLLIDDRQLGAARALVAPIETQLTTLPANRSTIYAKINLAESLMKLNPGGQGTRDAAQLLAMAAQQARSLGDRRAEAYALGSLGTLYETQKQWDESREVTEQALSLAQSINAADIAYRWQWQLGRILKTTGDRSGAIAAYSEAVNTLQAIRGDLVAISTDVQFSFREQVEPVYRELVSLLLEEAGSSPTLGNKSDLSQKNLAKALQVVESLQLAELDNFFRDACLDAKPIQIDRIDQRAAVIYPVILPDRLEVILSVPNQPLKHYTTAVKQGEVEFILRDLRAALSAIEPDVEQLSAEVYDWLIRPLEADLAQSQIKTLVFVLDGPFRNIPMSALFDGKQYLVEKYSVALTPGLQLLDPQPLAEQQLRVLTAGLSEARQGFEPLPGVAAELAKIGTEVPSQLLLNETFTATEFEKVVASLPFPVVHLATHGNFSSNAEDTFVLTWDDKINANQLQDLLKNQLPGKRDQAIELLVLSACETARGDDRAALGLAGVAVRAGARSTVASLWLVSDEATSLLMSDFYNELADSSLTKAEALRQAQLAVFRQDKFKHPYFWSAFILVGNWL